MHKKLLLFAMFLGLSGFSFGQIVGTNVFLQGAYVEIGELGNGSFGTSTSPAGYHPHSGFGGSTLAEVYDYGHDGWAVGSPPYMGDYTYPGSPFEGWEIQIGSGRAQAYEYSGTGYTSSGLTLSGSITGYTNAGGSIRSMWTGVAGGTLNMKQETRIDTLASCVVMTTKMYNTTSSPITGVYYMRTCDPDNDESWPGGGFPTTNTITHQNEDATHRVLVSAVGALGAYTYMGLGTKDCRAKAFIYGSWGLSIGVDLSTVWSGTYSDYATRYALSSSFYGDVGIGLVYNIGTIPANDSAVVSCAYIFNGVNGLDSPGAFPDPQLVVHGDTISSYPDTFFACSFPTLTNLDVNLIYADDKNWTWGEWTWVPATGLSATTGTSVTIDLTALPSVKTYTVYGTDSGVHMLSCNRKMFVFTVKTCHFAQNNSPCYGDTLKLYISSVDSTGSSTTYMWHGPGGYTSATKNPFIYPATFADSGMYWVVRTRAGVNDTDSTHVVIHPLPPINISTNIPLCGPMNTTLSLGVSPDSVGETYLWTGPTGFTSTLVAPTRPFTLADTGTYVVHATTRWGCKNTGSVFVYPGIVPGFTWDNPNLGCVTDTVTFHNTTSNAFQYEWYFGDGTTSMSTLPDVTHVYASGHQAYTVRLVCHNSHCDSSKTLTVDLTHSVKADFEAIPDTLCFGSSTAMQDMSAVSAPGGPGVFTSYTWNFGDGSTDATIGAPPAHTYSAPGMYTTELTVVDSIGCTDHVSRTIFVLQPGILNNTHDTTLCISMPLPLPNTVTLVPNIALTGFEYSWTPSTDLSSGTVKEPDYSGLGLTTYTDTVILAGISDDIPWRCIAWDTIRIHSVHVAPLTFVTPSQTISFGSSVQLNAGNHLIYWWVPDDGSLDNPNISNPVATPNHTTTYIVYGRDDNSCLDSAFVTITVDSAMDESVPSAFTPNGDGLNDMFRPVGLKYQRMVDFRVFNRWGQLVFESNNVKNGWDGTLNGQPQDIGTYFYVITVARPGGDGNNLVYKGEVTLIR